MAIGNWQKYRWTNRSKILTIAVLLLLGLFFRTAYLAERVYWVDEVATSIRVAGYTRQQVINELADGRLLTIADLQHYQRLTPERDWSDTLAALQQSPEHAPLYFVLARLWSQLFGSSVTAMRSLSVVLSLLALPCMMGLSRELFGSGAVAAMSMSLLAVSPFFVAYAQEARPYSLWTLLLLLNGWLLLRALRHNQRWSWLGYGITAVLGLYTSLLSGLVLLGQAVYVVVLELPKRQGSNRPGSGGKWWRSTPVLRTYLLMLAGAIVAFLPWLWVIAQHWDNLQDNTTWMRDPLNELAMLAIWIYSLVILIFDVPVSTGLNGGTIAKFLTAVAVISLMGFSLYWLCQQTVRRVWLYVITLMLPVPLTLMAIDLFFDGQASATPRYLVPCQLGILLAMSYWLGQNLRDELRQNLIRQGIVIAVLALCLLSNFTNLGRIPDYQKARNRENVSIAAILNQRSQPLLWAESEETIDLLSLSHALKPTIQMQIFPADRLPSVVSPCQTVFLFNPSETLRQKIQQTNGSVLEAIYQPDLLTTDDIYLSLWQLQNLPPACQSP